MHYRACISLANSLLSFYFLQMHWTSLLASLTKLGRPPTALIHNCVKLTITGSQEDSLDKTVMETSVCQTPLPTTDITRHLSVSLLSRLVLTL